MASLTSPYGTNPATAPTCPVGYTPRYVDGYGWVCAETPADTDATFQQFLQTLGPLGVTMPASGLIPTLSVSAQITAIIRYLEQHYHAHYVVIPIDHDLLSIVSVARAAAEGLLPSPEISGIGTDAALNAQAEAQARGLAAQYARQYQWPYHVYRVTWPPDGVEFAVVPATAPLPAVGDGGQRDLIATYPG
ncbi:MAG: hypothetical protein C7B45_16625 [Sulfobacillus acidophilus]|uniref:Uncharacterized protein n=1 Tax=Sulfobacillus acidophilus TaxID=53633 RepID=A0A2T2WCX0_9FIRM|nr:MAG: hypothetical protein C7B45_16625 [Sulfobacillus acidophilus]